MNKLFSILIFGMMLVLAIIFTETAIAMPDDDNYLITPQAAAQALYELGLFKGTEYGFELERGINRAEAAVMVVRLLGGEEEALSGNIAHPFSDVPEWAAPYIGWLFAKGLTNGTGNNLYSPSRRITYEQYVLFLLRSVRNLETIAADGGGVNYYLLSPVDIFGFTDADPIEYMEKTLLTRGDAAVLSVHALSLKEAKGKTNALRLIEKGVFSGGQILEQVGPLLGEQYVKDNLIFEYPLYYLDEETPFLASGATLFWRDEDNLLALYKSDHEERCVFGILYMDAQKTVFYFSADKTYIYSYDNAGQKLIGTGLSLAKYPNMHTVYGKHFYLADDTDIYSLDLGNNTWKHIYQPGMSVSSPKGFCVGPRGIVAVLKNGSFLYFNNESATAVLPRLWHESLAWDTTLISYDGDKLIFRHRVLFSQSMGELIYHDFTVVAEADKAACTGFECIFSNYVEESVLEVDEEYKQREHNWFQQRLNEIYRSL